jgi:hypothetical protein
MMCGGCAVLTSRIGKLEQLIKSPVAWPAWYVDIQMGVNDVVLLCRELGIEPEKFWTIDNAKTRDNSDRARIIQTLHNRGWTAGRIALIGRTSERSVRRALRSNAEPCNVPSK